MKRGLILALLAWAGTVGSGLAQSDQELAEAGKKYRAACLNCHQPPDLTFATDRAWLDQVNRTA